jgi:hypothetical protein
MQYVFVFQDPPFVMRNDGPEMKSGNDRWKGFLIDLIAAISVEVGFRYILYEVPDGNYGGLSASGEWNGMIKELLIGVCVLTPYRFQPRKLVPE